MIMYSIMQKSSCTLVVLLLCFMLPLCFVSTTAESFIGVNYGNQADNLPPATTTARLLQSTTIEKVRLYGTDPAIMRALANTSIGIVIGIDNGDIPQLAFNQSFANRWIESNVVAYRGSNIIVINVGNEVLMSSDRNLWSQLLSAMQNVQNALHAASLGGIKVSTVHSMSVLGQSYPPSSGAFDSTFTSTMRQILRFLNETGSPFMINPYPFFAYRDSPSANMLAYCLFLPNAGVVDPRNGHRYMNMFDAQVDAVYSALSALGYEDVEIVVAETGWPNTGDVGEVGPGLDNARAYNGNLIRHLRSMVGTPLMPGKSVDTYIFALYDENMKTGPGSERAFGLYKPNLTMNYDVGLSRRAHSPAPTPTYAPTFVPSTRVDSLPPSTSITPVTPSGPVTNPAPTRISGLQGPATSFGPSHSLFLILVTVVAFTLVGI